MSTQIVRLFLLFFALIGFIIFSWIKGPRAGQIEDKFQWIEGNASTPVHFLDVGRPIYFDNQVWSSFRKDLFGEYRDALDSIMAIYRESALPYLDTVSFKDSTSFFHYYDSISKPVILDTIYFLEKNRIIWYRPNVERHVAFHMNENPMLFSISYFFIKKAGHKMIIDEVMDGPQNENYWNWYRLTDSVLHTNSPIKIRVLNESLEEKDTTSIFTLWDPPEIYELKDNKDKIVYRDDSGYKSLETTLEKDDEGDWIEVDSEFKPWYRRFWFRLIVGFIIFLMVLGIFNLIRLAFRKPKFNIRILGIDETLKFEIYAGRKNYGPYEYPVDDLEILFYLKKIEDSDQSELNGVVFLNTKDNTYHHFFLKDYKFNETAISKLDKLQKDKLKYVVFDHVSESIVEDVHWSHRYYLDDDSFHEYESSYRL